MTAIVSLVPSLTEMICWLGREEMLVGRTTFCTEPASVRRVRAYGGTKNPKVSAIVALRPDLVVANKEENRKEDIESLLDGRTVKPNRGANIAYKQRFVDFLGAQEDNINHEQFMRIVAYIRALEPVIMRNTVREIQDKINKMQIPQAPVPGAPTQPLQPNGGGGELPISPVAIPNGLPATA